MNSACISGYVRRIGQIRQVSGDTKVVDIVISMKKASVREEQKYDNIKCTCWRGQADYVEKYVTEGEYAVVQGQLSTRNYEDKDRKKGLRNIYYRYRFTSTKSFGQERSRKRK